MRCIYFSIRCNMASPPPSPATTAAASASPRVGIAPPPCSAAAAGRISGDSGLRRPSPSPPPPVASLRLCITNRNIPGVLAQVTALFARHHINILNQSNRSHGSLGLNVFDILVPPTTEGVTTGDLVRLVQNIDGIMTCDLGHFSPHVSLNSVRTSVGRICILNKNTVGSLSSVVATISAMGLNIIAQRNRSHGARLASTVIDIDLSGFQGSYTASVASLAASLTNFSNVLSADVGSFSPGSLALLTEAEREEEEEAQASYYSGSGLGVSERTEALACMQDRDNRTADVSRVVYVMVGLPARGKSFIARKLAAFIAWGCKSRARVFNAGKYRRKDQIERAHSKSIMTSPSVAYAAPQDASASASVSASASTPAAKSRATRRRSASGALHDGAASFFSNSNIEARRQREAAADACLQDILHYLFEDKSPSCAIFDATNSSRARRAKIVAKLQPHGVRVVFVEVICTDDKVLEENVLNKVRSSPDYAGMSLEMALADFRQRIQHYTEQYEPIGENADCKLSFIKLIDMGNRCVMNKCFGVVARLVTPYLLALHVGTRPIWMFLLDDNGGGRDEKGGSDFDGLPKAISDWIRTALWVRSIEGMGSMTPDQEEDADFSEKEERLMLLSSNATAHCAVARQLAVQCNNNADAIASSGGGGAPQQHPLRIGSARHEPPTLKISVQHEALASLRPLAAEAESWVDLCARLAPVAIEIEQQTAPVLVLVDLMVCRALLSYFLRISKRQALGRALPTGQRTIIQLIPGQSGGFQETNHAI